MRMSQAGHTFRDIIAGCLRSLHGLFDPFTPCQVYMAPRQSIDHAAMREKNLALILTTLHENAPLSRVALASMTQLNKATVSSLVQELRSKQLVREIGINSEISDVGRPAINLELNP